MASHLTYLATSEPQMHRGLCNEHEAEDEREQIH
jgi:hypothetical protein